MFMKKMDIKCSFMLTILCISLVYAVPIDELEEMTVYRKPANGNSRSEVYASLMSSYGNSGVVGIRLPEENFVRPVCYPETFLEHLEAAKLIHVLCKQLGYITFGSRHKEVYSEKQPGLASTSAQCTSQEDAVSECPWRRTQTRLCQEVLATRCTTCNTKLIANNGSIHNPGFPHIYVYSVACEWTIEVPGGTDIQLHFEQFTLPRTERHECESYIELSYGNQKKLVNQRFCPAERVDRIFIPYNSARIRFSSGIYRTKYDKQQTHYGFNIVFIANLGEETSFQPLKIILLSTMLVVFFVMCMCLYCCYSTSNVNTIPPRPTEPLGPNAPTQEELETVFEFQRCAIQKPLDEYIPKQGTFTVYQSDTSNTDSSIQRWRSKSDLQVSSALAPIGPGSRKLTYASTPRSIFSQVQKWNGRSSAERLQHLRTKLVTRFSSSSSHNMSDISLYFPSAERRSYSLLGSNNDDVELDNKDENKPTSRSKSESDGIPSIVVEFVN